MKHFSYTNNSLGFGPTDESNLMMSDVGHIPQTAASHQRTPSKQRSPAADMLREDPRDVFYQGERRRCFLSPRMQELST